MSIERTIKIITIAEDKATGTLKKTSAEVGKLEKTVKRAALGFLTLRTAQKAVEFVKLGAQAQAVEHRLVRFAGGADQATRYLEALNRGADNTIDRMTGMAQASRMLETHMASNVYEMEMAGAMVAKLGNQTWTTERRMQSLTMLLANQSIRRLDDFGLSVENVRRRQQKLEKQGISTEQAFKTAVFQEAEAALTTLGDTSELAATKIAQLEGAWKNMGIEMAESVAETADLAIGVDGLIAVMGTVPEAMGVWFRLLPIWRELMHDNRQEAAGLADELLNWATATINAFEGMEHVEGMGWIDPQVAQGWRDRGAALNELAQVAEGAALPSARAMLQAARDTKAAEYEASRAAMDYTDSLMELELAQTGVQGGAFGVQSAIEASRQTMMDASAAALDLAMSYTSYYQQAATAGAGYYGSMEDIEARYQKRVADIQGRGAGSAGGGAVAGRKFDRADIERGLRIKEAQLAEAEAKREGWAMGEKLEGVSWEDISREDRKWLAEHGKTLEDLQAEHIKTGDDITELERAQMADRIEDLKREIRETNELLERGHYKQHQIRVSAARQDTAALLEEAARRRDEEIAALEKSQAQREVMNQQSLGRIKLQQFDAWAEMNLATDGYTAEEMAFIEEMRKSIALDYGLITADTLMNIELQGAAWDMLFTNVEEGADDAKKAVKSLTNAIKSLPATAGQHWEDVIPAELRQFGGSVQAGQPYWTGERGPEIFIPRQSGYLHSNVQSKQITNQWGGNQTTYNVTDDRTWRLIQQEKRAQQRNAYVRSMGM